MGVAVVDEAGPQGPTAAELPEVDAGAAGGVASGVGSRHPAVMADTAAQAAAAARPWDRTGRPAEVPTAEPMVAVQERQVQVDRVPADRAGPAPVRLARVVGLARGGRGFPGPGPRGGQVVERAVWAGPIVVSGPDPGAVWAE